MTFDELQAQVQELVNRTKREYFELIRDYVKEHNQVPYGALMTRQSETIRVDKISISAPITITPHLATVIYHGARYTQKGEPFKRPVRDTHSTAVASDTNWGL